MTTDEATLAVIDALEALGVPYMLVGSFSSNYYGIGRSTLDADFVLQLEPGRLPEVVKRLGTSFHLDPQMSFETTTLTSRHIVEVVGTPFKIEFFYLSADAHDQERFRRRRRVQLLGREVSLPTVEDVLLTKLRWAHQGGRSKDREDVRNVIAVQEGRIDWGYLYSWCDRHGTRELLDEVRRSIPQV